jgi:hypothetical protein
MPGHTGNGIAGLSHSINDPYFAGRKSDEGAF